VSVSQGKTLKTEIGQERIFSDKRPIAMFHGGKGSGNYSGICMMEITIFYQISCFENRILDLANKCICNLFKDAISKPD
jgi:hypothetical protein